MTIELLNQEKKNFTTINMEHKITLSYSEQQEVELFCKLNNITTDELIKKSFKAGYNIEKYGLVGNMGGIQEKWVEKEVIQEKWVEIPVEVIKEVEKIVEVIKEVPVDRVVIKEVPVETVVTKIEYISDKTSENELLLKIQQLDETIFHLNEELVSEREEFSTKTQELTKIFQDKISKENIKVVEVEKEVVVDNSKQKMLESTLQNLRKDFKVLKINMSSSVGQRVI